MTSLWLHELKANWRSFRYPAFLLVILFFAILDPLTTKYMHEIVGYFVAGMETIMPDPTPEDAFSSYLADVSQIGFLVLIFSIMGCVAREKETGVAAWLLSKPLNRRHYLLAKLTVPIAVVTLGIFSCSGLAYLYTLSLLGSFSFTQAFLATVSLLLYALLLTTLTFTLSAILRTPLQAGGITMGLFFLSALLNMFLAQTVLADYSPNSLLSRLPDLVSGSAGLPDIAGALFVTALTIVLLFILAERYFAQLEL